MQSKKINKTVKECIIDVIFTVNDFNQRLLGLNNKTLAPHLDKKSNQNKTIISLKNHH